MTELEEVTRKQVVEFLPRALETAFSSYHAFLHQVPDDEQSKKFKDHHTACKAVIAHITLLLELAGSINVNVNDIAGGNVDLQIAFVEYQNHMKKGE